MIQDEVQIALDEAVLHGRLEGLMRTRVPGHLAVTPGKVQLGADLYGYPAWTPAAAQISEAKVRWKAVLLAVVAVEREHGYKVDLCITLSGGFGRAQLHTVTDPDLAQRLQELWSITKHDLLEEDFDPWLAVNTRWGGNPPARGRLGNAALRQVGVRGGWGRNGAE